MTWLIDEIVNESIVASELESSVEIKLDEIEAPDKIKDQIGEEFDNVISMLKFNDLGYEMFRTWYIDGRIVHHLLVNESNTKVFKRYVTSMPPRFESTRSKIQERSED